MLCLHIKEQKIVEIKFIYPAMTLLLYFSDATCYGVIGVWHKQPGMAKSWRRHFIYINMCMIGLEILLSHQKFSFQNYKPIVGMLKKKEKFPF